MLTIKSKFGKVYAEINEPINKCNLHVMIDEKTRVIIIRFFSLYDKNFKDLTLQFPGFILNFQGKLNKKKQAEYYNKYDALLVEKIYDMISLYRTIQKDTIVDIDKIVDKITKDLDKEFFG